MATSQHTSLPPDTKGSLIIPGRRPSWKRPGLLNKSSVIGTLARDKLLSPRSDGLCNSAESTNNCDEGSGVSQQRIGQLEKNITFLKLQHRDTLQQLHKEIERLKIENRGVCYVCSEFKSQLGDPPNYF